VHDEGIVDSWEDLFEGSDAARVIEPTCVLAAEKMAIVLPNERVSDPGLDSGLANLGQRGRRSRFRKDLVNLNKAVAKWLKKEAAGNHTRDETIEKISTSDVAKQLHLLHGSGFDEEEFVRSALGRHLHSSQR